MNQIVSSVLSSRLILSGFLAFFCMIIALLTEKFELFFLIWLFGVSQGINCYWYYIGNQKIVHMAKWDIFLRLSQFISITVSVILGFDVLSTILIQALVTLCINSYQILIIFIKYYPQINLLSGGRYMVSNYKYFVQKMIDSGYQYSNQAILGFMGYNSSIPAYAIADKIPKGYMGILSPVAQILYPKMVILFHNKKEKAYEFMDRLLLVYLIVGVILFVFVYTSSETFIITMSSGKINDPQVVQIIALSIIPISINNVLIGRWMIATGQIRAMNKLGAAVFSLNLLLCLILIPHFKASGAAIAFVASEYLYMFSLLIKYVKK
ncbi:polysaccharide biosynthesis C-terminal domain-containing protein [Deinococcus sp. 6YEL10]|uniref:polysaccharide biosynthesis C-terminal domain-containing protein n=1 Tax=Deinococcus sp. 6YEL10 TaxID=2745870 RepID=UPI001E4852C2|nr:polysaccharide biosynthesis C-terminal domain-containing protein [Deinococcus sp. 6YEL10]